MKKKIIAVFVLSALSCSAYSAENNLHRLSQTKFFNEVALRAEVERDSNQIIELHSIMGSQNSPFHVAAIENNLSAVRIYSKYPKYIDVKNSSGQTPLMLAIRGGNSAVIEELIKSGASLDIYDNSGNTAKDYAVARGIDLNRIKESNVVTVKSTGSDVESQLADIRRELGIMGSNVNNALEMARSARAAANNSQTRGNNIANLEGQRIDSIEQSINQSIASLTASISSIRAQIREITESGIDGDVIIDSGISEDEVRVLIDNSSREINSKLDSNIIDINSNLILLMDRERAIFDEKLAVTIKRQDEKIAALISQINENNGSSSTVNEKMSMAIYGVLAIAILFIILSQAIKKKPTPKVGGNTSKKSTQRSGREKPNRKKKSEHLDDDEYQTMDDKIDHIFDD